jgi:hypothetical protein
MFFMALIASISGAATVSRADDPRAGAARQATDEGPTKDEFYLKIDSLIDNVADLDVRRFTILAEAGKTLKFNIDAGIGSKGHRTADDKEGVRRLEAIVLLRLHGEGADTKIRRLMKFHRTKGTTIETDLGAPGRTSLAGVVEIKVKSGRYPVGKPLTVGTVNGQDIVIVVE